MANKNIHFGDVGSDIIVHFVQADGSDLNVSTSTANSIHFKKPDGTVVTKTATKNTGGADGRIKYTLVADDINLLGIWSIWGDTTLPAGKRTSDSDYFTVIG